MYWSYILLFFLFPVFPHAGYSLFQRSQTLGRVDRGAIEYQCTVWSIRHICWKSRSLSLNVYMLSRRRWVHMWVPWVARHLSPMQRRKRWYKDCEQKACSQCQTLHLLQGSTRGLGRAPCVLPNDMGQGVVDRRTNTKNEGIPPTWLSWAFQHIFLPSQASHNVAIGIGNVYLFIYTSLDYIIPVFDLVFCMTLLSVILARRDRLMDWRFPNLPKLRNRGFAILKLTRVEQSRVGKTSKWSMSSPRPHWDVKRY